MKGYAYILTHPGTPMIFWSHFFDFNLKDNINPIIKVRKDNNIKNTSTLSIVTATANLYTAIIDERVAVKIGTANWTPSGSGWVQRTSGDGYIIWDKGTVAKPVLTISPAGGSFSTGTTISPKLTAISNEGTPTIYYTIDGSEPTTSSPSAEGTITLSVNSNTTIKAFAKLNLGESVVRTEVYQFSSVPSGITVYFKPPANPTGNWSVNTIPKIYSWKNATNLSGSWPGNSMTLHEDGWYKYTFPSETGFNMIFNNGNSDTGDHTKQTANLENIISEKWYDWDKKAFVLSVEDENLNEIEFSISPNPTSGIITIKSTEDLNEFGVYNLIGELIHKGKIIDNIIDISTLPASIYYIKCLNKENKIYLKKIIKI